MNAIIRNACRSDWLSGKYRPLEPTSPSGPCTPSPFRWVKNDRGKYTEANAEYLQFLGLASESDLRTRCDAELFPDDLSDQYWREDRSVLDGSPVYHQIELAPDFAGRLHWQICTKEAFLGQSGKAIATLGTMCVAEQAATHFPECADLDTALQLMITDFPREITVGELASSVRLSPSQFTRRFRSIFYLTPHQFLLRIRALASSQLLTHSDLSIVEVAMQTGFYDQSHLVRHFHRLFSVSPSGYRRRFELPGQPLMLPFGC